MSTANRTTALIAALILAIAGMTHAFAPVSKPASSSSALNFGFLKELGLEKPDWLPDFGDKKDEAVEAPAPVAEAVDVTAGEESEVATSEE